MICWPAIGCAPDYCREKGTVVRKLIIESLMPAGGVIFSDGIENDFLAFTSGAVATIGLAKETARLVLNIK